MVLNEKNHIVFFKTLAKISFLIMLFFVIFGTSIPFHDKITDADEISTSSILNQILYSVIFLSSLISLIPKRSVLLELIKKEKFLSLFLLWCMLSIIWSDYSAVSFKRFFRVFTLVSVGTAFLLHCDSKQDILKYTKCILYPYLILSLVSIMIIPGALDPDFNTWRGFASHKNDLGQISLVSIMICFYVFRSGEKVGDRLLSLLMLLLSLLLLFGSMSMTSILCFMILILIGISFLVDDYVRKLIGFRGFFVFLTGTTLIGIFLAVCIIAPDLIDNAPGLVGKDTSFSGRTDLWAYIFKEIKNHPIMGSGFQGFWVLDSKNIMYLYQDLMWLPNQAHNGFLDILNETGVIGLGTFTLMLISYFKNRFTLRLKDPWLWIIISSLILNFQESSFFRPGNLIGFLFIFSYLILFVEIAGFRSSVNSKNYSYVSVKYFLDRDVKQNRSSKSVNLKYGTKIENRFW